MNSVKQLHQLAASEGLRSSAIMIAGNIFAQGLSGLAIIIISRLIGPEEFGIFSSGFSLALIVASLIDLGLTAAQQQAIPRAASDAERNRIFGTVLLIKSVLFLLAAILILPLSEFIGDKLYFSSSLFVFWIVLANIGSVFYNQLASMLLSIKRISQTVGINTTQAVSKLGLALAIFMTVWLSGEGVLMVYLALPLIIVPLAGVLLPDWYRFTLRFDRSSWLKMKSMALNNWVASFASVLIQNADIVLVSMYLSQNEAGLIGAASRLAMFIALVGSSLASVLNPRVSSYRSESDLTAFWRKALLLSASSAGLAIISFLIAKPLLAITVGSEYLSAAPVLGWLLAASWLSVGLAPLTALFYSYDKAWYFSVSAALQASFLLVGNALLLPSFGIIAAGWVRLTAQLVMVVFTIGIALMSHRQRFKQFPNIF